MNGAKRKWEKYGEDNNGVVHYIDKSAISYPSKNIIRVWRKRVFPEIVPGSKGMKSSHKEIVTYDEMDCKNETYRSLELQGVKWDGTLTEIFRKPTPWMPCFDNTADDRVLENYCKEAAKAPKP